MNKSSAQDQTPGGFEGRAGGSKGNPTPTASDDSPKIYTYRGRLLSEMTREELLAVCTRLAKESIERMEATARESRRLAWEIASSKVAYWRDR
jgi:hypothetical protein